MRKKTAQIGIRITPELKALVEKVARREIRSVAQQAEHYIKQGLERDGIKIHAAPHMQDPVK